MNQEYPLFAKWSVTLDWILDTVEKFPRSARFSLSSRISNIALDVLEKIIEAIYRKKRLYILYDINLYIEKLRVLFRICVQRQYISMKQYEFIISNLNEAGKMTGGWIKHETNRKPVS